MLLGPPRLEISLFPLLPALIGSSHRLVACLCLNMPGMCVSSYLFQSRSPCTGYMYVFCHFPLFSYEIL